MDNQLQNYYKEGINVLQNLMPEVAEHYNDFTGTCFEEGVLTKKQKQLVALGISLSHRDERCVRYHVGEALHKGATEAELWETFNVALAMSGGMMVSQSVHWIKDAISASNHIQ